MIANPHAQNHSTTSGLSCNSDDDSVSFFGVPRALVAIKFSIPMLYIDKLTVYLRAKCENALVDSENLLDSRHKSDYEFYTRLFELHRKLHLNRKNLKVISDILKQCTWNLEQLCETGGVPTNSPKVDS